MSMPVAERGVGGIFVCRYHLGPRSEAEHNFAVNFVRSRLAEYDFLGPQVNRAKGIQATENAIAVATRIRDIYGAPPCCIAGDDVMAGIYEMYRVVETIKQGRKALGELIQSPTAEPQRGQGEGRYLCDYHVHVAKQVCEEVVFWVVARLRAKMLNGDFFNGNVDQFNGLSNDPASNVADKIRQRIRLPVCCVLGDEKIGALIEEYKFEMAKLKDSGGKILPTVFAGWRQLRKESDNG